VHFFLSAPDLPYYKRQQKYQNAQPEKGSMDHTNETVTVRKPEGAHLLRFLFVGTRRDWNPGEGFTPPPGKVCVLPGNVVTWAPTLEEAQFKMHMALQRALSKEGPAWYETARKSMSKEDRELRSKLWDKVWEEDRPTHQEKLTTEQVDGSGKDSLHFVGGAECVILIESVSFVDQPDGRALAGATD